jgi:hypothetical protein
MPIHSKTVGLAGSVEVLTLTPALSLGGRGVKRLNYLQRFVICENRAIVLNHEEWIQHEHQRIEKDVRQDRSG